jgi:hypothetical protein
MPRATRRPASAAMSICRRRFATANCRNYRKSRRGGLVLDDDRGDLGYLGSVLEFVDAEVRIYSNFVP